MKSNFEFLNRYWPALAQIGAAAESYVYSDANACLYKLGMFGERLILEIFAFEHIKEPTIDNTHANRIRLLKREGLIPKKIDDILYALRKTRNDAVHAGADSVEDAKTLLSMTYNLAVWFMEVYGDWGYIAPAFVMPENVVQPDYESIIKEQEEKIVALSKQVDAVSTAASSKTSKERAEKGETASESMDLSEAETRYLIDEQFRKFGWEADTNNLRYSRGTRPQKGRNLAIAEWPTDSTVGKNGYADYALFVGLKLVGIVEAKKAAIDIPSVIDHQCKEYAKGIKAEHKDYVIGQWGAYKVPFVFATNGRKYLKQIETKSGIWCLDLRSGANAPKALQGWISPQGLMEQLEKDIAAANAALQNTPFDLLRDPDGLNLRKYQISAIEAAEQAVIDGKQTVLLSMATGTGKTRTILGMIYRFIKSDRFKRVLFLVDRTALGEQAEDVFKEVKIEELMTLDSIYNIKGLDEKEIDRETKIHIATVQSLVKRILYPEGDTMPSVTDYDLIVVDEAHRGYILDKEMSETEMLYRNQDDYISKYRTVIEYFDAVKIALTATPALHTTEIFGKPVFNYSYREAVIDGYLVDHDAPHNIRTKLRVEGINYQKGEQLAIYDPVNSSTIKEATAELLGHREAFSVLDKDRTHRKRPVVIDNHEDELIDHTRGYGEGQKPEDYLEAFREFINNNINAIAALRTVCTRPSELTREALKSLKLELDRHDFTEKQLNSAWNEMTNQDIVADIIAFIRQQALGSALVGHEQRVKHAFAKLRMNHEFNKTQLEWLKRIEKVLLEESVLDEQIFEVGAFKNAGGFTIIDRRFGGKLREIMTELNEYLYDDGGSVA